MLRRTAEDLRSLLLTDLGTVHHSLAARSVDVIRSKSQPVSANIGHHLF